LSAEKKKISKPWVDQPTAFFVPEVREDGASDALFDGRTGHGRRLRRRMAAMNRNFPRNVFIRSTTGAAEGYFYFYFTDWIGPSARRRAR
jgi:hypothetical protein